MWKAMALMCVLEGGEKPCPTVFFDETFETKQKCEVWLVRLRFYGLPNNKKIVLDDCYLER